MYVSVCIPVPLGIHTRQREGAFLLKTPDLVLPCFDASRSFTIVDIKVIDPATAASYVNMTSKSPLHRHRTLEVAGPRDYFGPSRRPHPGARMRVVTFVVSTFGSLGAQAEAQALIKMQLQLCTSTKYLK